METRTPADVQRILEERARRLSIAPTAERTEEQMQVVTLVMGGESYGIDVTGIQEIHPLRGLVALPSTPGFVAGVINIRGILYSVVNLRRFLGLPDTVGSPAKVAVVSAAGLTIGILADEVSDVRSVPLQNIAPASVINSGIHEEYVRGVTPEMLVILDLRAILADKRMIASADDLGDGPSRLEIGRGGEV